jgi:hypothetical protein
VKRVPNNVAILGFEALSVREIASDQLQSCD